jgi:23S rRNA (adenine-N6)-dimethyltransferase
VGAHVSRSHRAGRSPSGRHYLTPRVAAELVRDFEVRPDELVVEIGAGTGRLTRELARTGATVLAIELDEAPATHVLRAARAWKNVYVRQDDVLDVALPGTPFRAVGNIPFGITTDLLRTLIQGSAAERIDLIVQREVARKRAAGRGNVLAVLWAGAWQLEVRRTIDARSFHPTPGVDAAWLAGKRRAVPLVERDEAAAFERFVRAAFRRANAPVSQATGLSRPRLIAASVDPRSRIRDLPVEQWLAAFRAARRAR